MTCNNTNVNLSIVSPDAAFKGNFPRWTTFPVSERHFLDKDLPVILYPALLALAIVGVISDVIICLVMLRSRMTRKNLSNYFIFNLSAAELVFLLIGTPLIATFTSTDEADPIQCKIQFFISRACAATIFTLLSGIALDRYFNIAYPLKRLAKPLKRQYALSAVWLYAVACAVPFLYSANSIELEMLENTTYAKNMTVLDYNSNMLTSINRQLHIDTRNLSCGYKKIGFLTDKKNIISDFIIPDANDTIPEQLYSCGISTDNTGQITYTVYFTFAFLVPLAVMITTYSLTTVQLWKRSKNRIINGAVCKSKIRSLRMLVLAVVTFTATWGAVFIRDMLNAYSVFDVPKLSNSALAAYTLMGYTYYFSPIVNTILYSFYNANFRKEIKNTFSLLVRKMSWRTEYGQVSSTSNRSRTQNSKERKWLGTRL